MQKTPHWLQKMSLKESHFQRNITGGAGGGGGCAGVGRAEKEKKKYLKKVSWGGVEGEKLPFLLKILLGSPSMKQNLLGSPQSADFLINNLIRN